MSQHCKFNKGDSDTERRLDPIECNDRREGKIGESLSGHWFSAQTAKPIRSPNDEALQAFSIPQVADRLGVAYVTVWRLIQRGRLKCLRSIRHKKIPRSELERFLREDVK